MNAMNGPYLSITWKPKNFFSERLKNKKYILKKKIIEYSNILKFLIGMHVIIYRSILASQRSQSSNFKFKNEDNVREESKITTSCRSNETERN